MVVGKIFAMIMELGNSGNNFFVKWVTKVTDAWPCSRRQNIFTFLKKVFPLDL